MIQSRAPPTERNLAGIRHPTIHQAPGRRNRFAALVGGFENEVGLRRCDIEARGVIAELAFRNFEQGRHFGLVAPRHGESTAHSKLPFARSSRFFKNHFDRGAGSSLASDLRMLYFNRDRLPTMPDFIDPFVIPENAQGLANRFVNAPALTSTIFSTCLRSKQET
jgi:hypothetical protein